MVCLNPVTLDDFSDLNNVIVDILDSEEILELPNSRRRFADLKVQIDNLIDRNQPLTIAGYKSVLGDVSVAIAEIRLELSFT